MTDQDQPTRTAGTWPDRKDQGMNDRPGCPPAAQVVRRALLRRGIAIGPDDGQVVADLLRALFQAGRPARPRRPPVIDTPVSTSGRFRFGKCGCGSVFGAVVGDAAEPDTREAKEA